MSCEHVQQVGVAGGALRLVIGVFIDFLQTDVEDEDGKY